MKRLNQRIRPWLIRYFALPSDVILELPRITIIGQLHVYIENHQGMEAYSDTELTLRTKQGFIRITGSDFVLKMMVSEEILLEGTIKEVTFIAG